MQLRPMLLVPVVIAAITLLAAEKIDPAQMMFEAAKKKEVVDGDLNAAIQQYKAIASKYAGDRAVAANALVRMADCYEKLGDAESQKIYERVLREYADQKEAVALARVRLGRNGPARETGILARQVWAGSEVYANGRPSPDGRYLPFVRDGRLSLHDLTTGENRVLASEHDCAAESPVFTPDGKRIAYFCYTRAADKKELKIMTLDGSNIRAFPYDFVPAAITPDSQVAAGLFYRDKEFVQLALVNLSTGKLTVLKSLDWRRPEIGNFSPDGRYLVYSLKERQDSQDQDVYSIAVDGSSEAKLVSEPGAHRGPFFTPNGSRVVFTSNRSGRWDLWSIRVAGGKAVDAPELAKTDIGEVFTMGFSQGGSLYFVQEIVEQEAYTVEVDPATWRITGGPKRVSDRPINNTAAPQWSPDGKWLAFLKLQPDPGASRRRVTFVVRAVDSSQEREFPVPFGNVDDSTVYRWFRDSQSLMLVQHTVPSQTSFFRLDIESGQVRPLFNPPLAATPSASISQDGRAIVYGGTQLISRNIETGEERILAKAPHSPLVWPTPSPDGRHVAFFSPIEPGPAPRNFSISYIPGSGGEPREVWHPTDGKWSLYPVGSATGLAWTPDSRGLLCVVYNYAAKLHEILHVPLDGSEPRTTGIAMPEVSVSSIRPDGRRIGYTGGGRSRQVWMLDNLFPETSRKR